MKLLKKVGRLEVKRCFAITHSLRKLGVAKEKSTYIPTREKYLQTLKKAKQVVDHLTEKQLDKIVGVYKKRLRLYDAVEWYIGEVKVKEVGVWRGAGGLPISWTQGSLLDTAKEVKEGLKTQTKEIKKRSRVAIPAILGFKTIIKKEKHLFPIIFQQGINLKIRKGMSKQEFEVDDGSMRAIAFTISGDKKIQAYIGLKSVIK